MRSRDRIQAKVDILLKLNSKKEWEDFLKESANKHNVLYHYTTFSNLKSILESRQWWVGRTDRSNDPVEKRMYCLSFSRGLGTMAMWGNYSQPAGNGVRIKFDLRANFKTFWLFLLICCFFRRQTIFDASCKTFFKKVSKSHIFEC